ncbi:F-box and leucine-rich repeat protein 13 [Macrotis lagotis]|uniref:F-box and leucine-rich repeat protein 13 n=1 Tax=Macrotis lagotis TaxID=92651 RepID=UPI003D68C183
MWSRPAGEVVPASSPSAHAPMVVGWGSGCQEQRPAHTEVAPGSEGATLRLVALLSRLVSVPLGRPQAVRLTPGWPAQNDATSERRDCNLSRDCLAHLSKKEYLIDQAMRQKFQRLKKFLGQSSLMDEQLKMPGKEKIAKQKKKETRKITEEDNCLKRDPSICSVSSSELIVLPEYDISKLPERVIIQIFRPLSIIDLANCAQVNKAWRSMTRSRSLWSDINFSLVYQIVDNTHIGQLLQRWRSNVLQLNFHGCSSLQWSTFKYVNQCKNLHELNVSECEGFNDDIMKGVSEGCTALTHLNVAHTFITNKTLRLLSRSFPNLQKLSLAYCRNFTEKGLLYLSLNKGCHKITDLDLSGCTQISVQGFKDLASSCNGLKHLVINDMPTLTDSCIKALVEKCRNITSVVIIGSPHLSDIAFKYLTECSLSKIRIEGNNRITDLTFKFMDKCYETLHHIYLTDCGRITDVSLKSIANLKHLHVLNLANCRRIGDTGLRTFLGGPSSSKLRELNLTNCAQISDLALAQIGERCRSLNYLIVRNCTQLTDCGIEFITQLPNLISVDLSGTNITDEALTLLSSHKKLKELTVSECGFITDSGIKEFCQLTPILELLDISYCLKLSGEILKILSAKCFSITSLSIAGCPKMNDIAIKILSKKCHYLHILDISGCICLTDKAIEYLLEGCKQLRVLKMRYCRRISKMADFRISSQVKYCEYSIEDPPFWFGYDYKGIIFHDKKRVQGLLGKRRESLLGGPEGKENAVKNTSLSL